MVGFTDEQGCLGAFEGMGLDLGTVWLVLLQSVAGVGTECIARMSGSLKRLV